MGNNSSDQQILNLILERLSALDERDLLRIEMIHEIRENQIQIQGKLDNHLSAHASTNNSLSHTKDGKEVSQLDGLVLTIWKSIKSFILPTVMALMIAFWGSISYTGPKDSRDGNIPYETQISKKELIYFNREKFDSIIKAEIEKSKGSGVKKDDPIKATKDSKDHKKDNIDEP